MAPSSTLSDLPRRFYKDVTLAEAAPGWHLLLDGRRLQTPARQPLNLPTRALATEIAGEWAAQHTHIDPAGMPLTRLANVAIDHSPDKREELADEVCRYCETDLLCHLAEAPQALVRLQESRWGPVRAWAGAQMGVALIATQGIIAVVQPPASLAAARAYALGLDDFRLTGLAWACGLFGSALLGLGLMTGYLQAEEAFGLSCLDETWQMQEWGEDEEAGAALAYRRAQAIALGRFSAALSGWPAGSD